MNKTILSELYSSILEKNPEDFNMLSIDAQLTFLQAISAIIPDIKLDTPVNSTVFFEELITLYEKGTKELACDNNVFTIPDIDFSNTNISIKIIDSNLYIIHKYKPGIVYNLIDKSVKSLQIPIGIPQKNNISITSITDFDTNGSLFVYLSTSYHLARVYNFDHTFLYDIGVPNMPGTIKDKSQSIVNKLYCPKSIFIKNDIIYITNKLGGVNHGDMAGHISQFNLNTGTWLGNI